MNQPSRIKRASGRAPVAPPFGWGALAITVQMALLLTMVLGLAFAFLGSQFHNPVSDTACELDISQISFETGGEYSCYGYRRNEELTSDIKNDLGLHGTARIKFKPSNMKHDEINDYSRDAVSFSFGPVILGACLPMCERKSPLEAVHGASKRVLNAVPEFEHDYNELRTFTYQFLQASGVQPIPSDADTTVETFLSKCNWTEKQRQLVREAWEKHFITGITDFDMFCKSFIKEEFYTDFKLARGIQSRSALIKALVGPVFRLIEEQVYDLPWFVKHTPTTERPSVLLDQFGSDGEIQISDYSSFEGLFTKELMEAVEMAFYNYMTSNSTDPVVRNWWVFVNELLLGTNRMVFRGVVLEVEAKRMSGEMNTSLGNAISNYILLQYMAFKKNATIVARVEGDDAVFKVLGAEKLDDKDFRDCGLIAKYATAPCIGMASFCGNVFDEVDMDVITDPFEAVCKFAWLSMRYLNARKSIKLALLRAKALSFIHQYPNCPVIAPFVDRVLYLTRSITVSQKILMQMNTYEREEYFLNVRGTAPSVNIKARTRALTADYYGIGIDLQLHLESKFRAMSLDGLSDVSVFMPEVWQNNWRVYVGPGLHKHYGHKAQTTALDGDLRNDSMSTPKERDEDRAELREMAEILAESPAQPWVFDNYPGGGPKFGSSPKNVTTLKEESSSMPSNSESTADDIKLSFVFIDWAKNEGSQPSAPLYHHVERLEKTHAGVAWTTCEETAGNHQFEQHDAVAHLTSRIPTTNNLAGLKGIQRAQFFDAEVENGRLTEDGANWLVASLDPYHDFERSLSGYPDISTSKSVVRLIQQTKTVTVPATAGAGLWDCHVVLVPFSATDDGTTTGPVLDFDPWYLDETLGNNVGLAASEITSGTGGGTVTILTMPAGQQSWFTDGATTKTVYGMSPVILGNGAPGSMRLVAGGFEVTNTTAEIYKQGSVSVYTHGTSMTADTYSNAAGDSWPATTYSGFVTSSTQAFRTPGSVQWEAADGVYVPARFATNVNPVVTPDCRATLMCVERNGSDSTNYNYLDRLSKVNNRSRSFYHFPINTSGAYFTGLSNQTTLTVTSRFYVEMVPALSSNFIDLASPPAEYDPWALELYTRVANSMPPGCRKGDNDAGDWFRNAARKASAFTANALSNPAVSGLIGMSPLGAALPALKSLSAMGMKIPDQRVFGRPTVKLSAAPKLKPLTAQAIVNNTKPQRKQATKSKKALVATRRR